VLFNWEMIKNRIDVNFSINVLDTLTQ
jgi:hypothetical protein